MENEIFKILTKVKKDELSRIDAMEQLLRLFDVSGRSELLFCSCGSRLVKTTGDYHCVNAKCSV
jgi:hypothetical protein